MKPGFQTWAASIAASVLLAACGGGGSAAGPGPVNSVRLTASGPADPAPSGGPAKMEVVIMNPGDDAATGVSFSPNLAPALALTGFTCTAAGGATCPAAITVNANALANLPGRSSLTLVLDLKVPAASSGPLISQPAVQATNDAATSDNSAAVSITAYTADLIVRGSGSTTPVAAGSVTNYTMTVSNAGPDEARNVEIVNLMGGFQTAGTPSCTASGGATCPTTLGAKMSAARLPRNGTLVFNVPAEVMQDASGNIANVMTVSAAGDPVATNNVAAVEVMTYAPAPPPVLATQSLITLQSDAGDYIGAGRSYSYTRSNAVLSVSASGGRLSVRVTGDQDWAADFQQPAYLDKLTPGNYAGLTRYPFHNPAAGGLSWSGSGRGCNTLSGSFNIKSVTYTAGQLTAVDLSFAQYCENGAAALRGQVRWFATDSTTPPGPITPSPAYLWAPAADATPSSGNYVYLQSDGDFIGAGRTYTYTQRDATLSVSGSGARATVRVTGDQSWSGDFQAMLGVTSLQPGYYSNLQRFPFQNPTRGGMSWSGEGRGCNTLTGWFAVDRATYVNGTLTALDLRFEQHCEGAASTLRGKVHWDESERTTPPGPLNPPPADLWQPAAGATPTSGSYVYLASDPGDYIGAGRTATYTPTNASLGVSLSGRLLSVSVRGDQAWSANFQGMNSITELQPGYYGSLQRYPFNNVARGGMSWSGEGRGCNQLTGWFVVDAITVVGGQLTSLDLRFEQHCEGGTAALRGKIHWTK